MGFDPNLTHLSVLVEREHDDNAVHQLAVQCKRLVPPSLYGLGGCTIEQRIAQ
jgi:hypothetical protein